MVVGSLIGKFIEKESPIMVFGNGNPIRDFTYSEDIAEGMLKALEKGWNCESFNLGIGKGYSIRDLVKYIINGIRLHEYDKFCEWSDLEYLKNMDNKRVLNTDKSKKELSVCYKTELEEGINKTIDWYIKNKDIVNIRYNVFEK
jgi:nucleoside-diphosphate-sugar epimerase